MAEILTSMTLSPELHYLMPQSMQTDEPALPANQDDIDINEENSALVTEGIRQEAYESGIAQGRLQAAQDLAEQGKLLTALLQNIPESVTLLRQQMRDEIANIVLAIVQQFFIDQQHNRESVTLQINQIIARLNEKQSIELSLHPKDLALLQQGLLKLDIRPGKNFRVISSENLPLGGCIIKSEHGVFDASIERQIDNLKQVLLQIKSGEQHE